LVKSLAAGFTGIRACTQLFTKCTKSKYQEGHHYHRPFTLGYKIFLKTLWSLLLIHGKWEYLYDQSVGVVQGFQNIPQTPKPSLTLGYVNIHRPSVFFLNAPMVNKNDHCLENIPHNHGSSGNTLLAHQVPIFYTMGNEWPMVEAFLLWGGGIDDSGNKLTPNRTRGVSHCGLAIYIKKVS